MLYEYFNEHFGAHDTGPQDNTQTGRVVPLPPSRPSQHTLSPTDLAPAARGSQPARTRAAIGRSRPCTEPPGRPAGRCSPGVRRNLRGIF